MYLRARTVATSTMQLGAMPAVGHLISRNFSAPRSEPKPASVMVISASFSASRVARMELQPWAMLAKGPPCIRQGVPVRVWTRLGLKASRSRAAMAPTHFRSLA